MANSNRANNRVVPIEEIEINDESSINEDILQGDDTGMYISSFYLIVRIEELLKARAKHFSIPK